MLPPAQGTAIAAEVSGARAMQTVRVLSTNHRMRGSTGFRAAAEAIRDRLQSYGLEGVEIISLPADGTIFYGTQRSRPGWNARSAELWEGNERIASWADQPLSLAQDSVSGRAEAELVDIGAGTSEADYQGKDVRGRLVLTSSQPEAVQDLAIGRYRRGGDRLLGAEPAHRLVGRGRDPAPLGPSQDLLRASDLRLHGHARPAPVPGRRGCGRARRSGSAPRSMPGASRAPI